MMEQGKLDVMCWDCGRICGPTWGLVVNRERLVVPVCWSCYQKGAVSALNGQCNRRTERHGEAD